MGRARLRAPGWGWLPAGRGLGAVAWAFAFAVGCGDSEGTGGTSPLSTAAGSDGDGAMSSSDGAETDAGSGGGNNSEGTGAPLPDFLCEERSECVLHSDCCSCEALHVDQSAAACDDTTCMRGTCEVWGIERLLCSHTCHIELVECDPAMVTCRESPPDCEAGFVASLDERCWSGHCVPTELCRPMG
ncbi:MAG: hypothetical protein AAF721_35740 [Myxococcota bacterium]